MARVFVCYRREDAAGHAGRLRDTLASRLKDGEVFRDIDTITPGEDFLQAMSRAISSCDVFLAVIGPRWLSASAPDGSERLADPDDHVRREVREALARDVRVIPVLVGGAEMPRPGDLPPDLQALATRNAITLDDEGWSADVERLVAAIQGAGDGVPARQTQTESGAGTWYGGSRIRQRVASARARRVAMLAGGVAIVILFGALIVGLNRAAPEQRSAGGLGSGAGTVPEASDVSAASRSAAGAAAVRGIAATLPMGGEAEVDSATYEILDARIGPFSAGRELALQVRVTNKGRFAINFGGDPRLAVGDQLLAPASEPNEIVPAESAKEGRITFELPASSVDRGDFRVVQGAETGSIALDFSGKTGPTPASDAAARRAGGSTYSVAIDPSQAVLRFGEMTYVARSAHVHRYAHKLTLTVNVQMSNGSRYDAGLTDGEFRLVVDEEARPPADPFFKIVRADAADAVDVVFDMPLHVRHAVLRTRVGEIVKEISLQLPSFQNSTARDGTG